jgi:hypothetical protein
MRQPRLQMSICAPGPSTFGGTAPDSASLCRLFIPAQPSLSVDPGKRPFRVAAWPRLFVRGAAEARCDPGSRGCGISAVLSRSSPVAGASFCTARYALSPPMSGVSLTLTKRERSRPASIASAFAS